MSPDVQDLWFYERCASEAGIHLELKMCVWSPDIVIIKLNKKEWGNTNFAIFIRACLVRHGFIPGPE